MSQLDDAIARYNKLLEAPPYRDLTWAKALQERMEAERLCTASGALCPFLRPHFVTRRQYDAIVKVGECLISAIDRMEKMALATPNLLNRMELLPAEKMLAGIDPGYQVPEVVARLDSHLNGALRIVQYNADSPTGMAYAEGLADVFYDAPPVKEFRKRYSLTKTGGKKYLLSALLKAYKQFGGSQKPNIAILEFRPSFHGGRPSEFELFRDMFREAGYNADLVTPDQLEFRNGVLRRGPQTIHLVYRRISVQEFLLRFDLSHPLVQAYRSGAVCVVNSFRSELAHKKAMLGLLTDESLTAKFPVAERKAIREHVPWTRLVAPMKTTYGEQTVDLPEFILQNREKLVLKPNDDFSDMHCFFGWELDEAAWDRALKQALRAPYVVQEKVEAVRAMFPLLSYGHLEFREMRVDVHNHAYSGKVAGSSSWLSSGGTGFSTASGLAPTYIIESKS
jgi:hypothetical protein